MANLENNLQLYLKNQILETVGFIRKTERSIEILTEGDSEFAKVVDDVVQSKLEDIQSYKFRLNWLQSQLNQITNLK